VDGKGSDEERDGAEKAGKDVKRGRGNVVVVEGQTLMPKIYRKSYCTLDIIVG